MSSFTSHLEEEIHEEGRKLETCHSLTPVMLDLTSNSKICTECSLPAKKFANNLPECKDIKNEITVTPETTLYKGPFSYKKDSREKVIKHLKIQAKMDEQLLTNILLWTKINKQETLIKKLLRKLDYIEKKCALKTEHLNKLKNNHP